MPIWQIQRTSDWAIHVKKTPENLKPEPCMNPDQARIIREEALAKILQEYPHSIHSEKKSKK